MFRVHFWPWKQPISPQGPFGSSSGAFDHMIWSSSADRSCSSYHGNADVQISDILGRGGYFKRSDKNRNFEHPHLRHGRTSADEDHVLRSKWHITGPHGDIFFFTVNRAEHCVLATIFESTWI